MTDMTPRLLLPLLQAGQAQKEIWHNEALATIDSALHPVAESIGSVVPPDAPGIGMSWIVGTAPQGNWAEHDNELATWTGGGWRFVDLPVGASLWVLDAQCYARKAATGWLVGEFAARRIMVGDAQVVGTRQPAIDAPSGGVTIDLESRTSIKEILTALQNHGLISG